MVPGVATMAIGGFIGNWNSYLIPLLLLNSPKKFTLPVVASFVRCGCVELVMEFIIETIIVLAVILFSMVLHELAHGFVAYKLGDDTAKDDGRLTLNPLKHLDPWLSIAMPLLLLFSGGPVFGGAKPVPVDSSKLKWGAWGMALVSIAGPLTNFLIAFVAFLIGFYSGDRKSVV